jgi:hypothetical protein
MLITGILGIFEPGSFSLQDSTSWMLTKSLKERKTFYFNANNASRLGFLVGTSPLLQPISVSYISSDLTSQSGFLLFERAIFDVQETHFYSMPGEVHYISNDNNEHILSLLTCAPTRTSNMNSLTRFLAITPQVHILKSNILDLEEFVKKITHKLWLNEPINWTTSQLHLTSIGSFAVSREMAKQNLNSATIVLGANGLSLEAGPIPLVIKYKATWAGAGQTTLIKNLSAGGSTSSCITPGSSDMTSGSYSGGGLSSCSFQDGGHDCS